MRTAMHSKRTLLASAVVLTVLAGCGPGTEGPPSSLLAKKVIGASGGTIEVEGGISIEIPAGALPGDVTITVEEVSDAPVPEGATPMGATLQLGPEGQTFDAPVVVKLPWSGPDNVPVELAHSRRGGESWSRLTEGAGFDETHVWAQTDSFSWFRPVVYQGAADSPIVLDSGNPTSQKFVARGSTPSLILRGAGFRGDTVVTLFKDGVTTTIVQTVKLNRWGGLEIQIPANFTASLGLITIEAKNPAASTGAAAAVYVIETPVLMSLSPSTIRMQERLDFDYSGLSHTVNVTANDLPDDLSLCDVWISLSFGDMAVLSATTTAPVRTASGFAIVVSEWHQVTGTSDLEIQCGGVRSNSLPITFEVIPTPE